MYTQHLFSNLLIFETVGILAMGIYAWQKRAIPGASVLFSICMASAFYSFGYGMELRSLTVEEVNFWSKIQYLGLPFIPVLWVMLAQKYTRVGPVIKGKLLLFLTLPGFVTCLLRWTSEYHHLMYGEMRLISNGYFDVLSFDKGPWYYIHFVYFFAMAFYSVQKYVRAGARSSGYVKQHMVIMAAASLIPFISITVNLLNIFPYQMDSGPFFILFDYCLFTIGIFRYNIQVIASLSRHRVFEWIADAVIVIDLQNRLIDFNRSAGERFPSLHRDFISINPEPFWQSYPQIYQLVDDHRNTVQSTDAFELELHLNGDEDKTWYQMKLKDLYLGNKVIGTALLLTDISKTKTLHSALEQLAQNDHLTGLYNRRHFIKMATESIEKLPVGSYYTFAIFDIDHFKRINDAYGHVAGDHVLKWLAGRLLALEDPEIVCGRYGGEEFILYMPTLGPDAVSTLLEKTRLDFETHTLSFEMLHIKFTASFGFTTHQKTTAANMPFDTLIMEADEALYLAKDSGRNQVKAYKKASES